MLSVKIALLVTAAHAAAGDSTRTIVTTAARAIEGDSSARVAARWEARLKRVPGDRVAMLGLGHLAQLQYRYDDAERRGRRAATDNDALAVRGQLLVAASLSARARFREAETALTDALRLSSTLPDSSLMAESMIALAATRMRTAGLAAADSMLARAEPLLSASDVRGQASLRCVRALVLATRGRADARAEALAAVDLARSAGDTRLRANCLMVVAQDWMRIGRGDSAGVVFGQVLALQQRARDRSGAAVTLQWRGYLASTLGNYLWALRDLRESVREGTAVNNPTPVAWASLSLATIARQFGDAEEAEAHAERARTSFGQSGDALGAANAFALRGDLARAAGDLRKARAIYREALARARDEGRMPATFALMRGLADVSMIERDYERAAAELDSVRAIVRDAGMRDVQAAVVEQELLLALRRGRLDDAGRLHAIIARTEEQPGRAFRSRMLGAEYHARRGNIDSAQAYATLSLDEMDRWRASLNDIQLRQAIFEPKTYLADPDLGFATVIAALVNAGRTQVALELAERRRARDLLDRLVRDQALTSDAPELPMRVGGREGIRNRDRFYRERSATLEELQAGIPDNRTAILEYITGRGGEPTTLFVISRSGLVVHRLVPIDSLAPSIARLARYVESGVAAPTLARTLGDALLGDAVRKLPASITDLVIVADDVLHRLPFDVLVVGDSAVLLDRFVISSTPSAEVARTLWQRGGRAIPGPVVALGNPSFAGNPQGANGPAAAMLQNGRLAALPFSAREATTAASTTTGGHVRLGKQASEQWMKTTPLQAYGVVHLATHAWVDERSLRRTAVALSAGNGEDGYLLPADFAALDLDADLVVLSACGTAGGVLMTGEGVLGLTAPLLVAGARSVVATGWRVSDRATMELVRDFYAALRTGSSVGSALHQAKRAARARGASAREWAAFSVVGNATVKPLRVATR